jgi:death-on-curing protein
MNYLTVEEIIAIHNEVIKETGGHEGIISQGNLDFIVSQMHILHDIVRKATILLYGILINHPFLDGNKRTALESMKTFLSINGRKFSASEEELWDKLHLISEGKLKFEEVIKWIKEVIEWSEKKL